MTFLTRRNKGFNNQAYQMSHPGEGSDEKTVTPHYLSHSDGVSNEKTENSFEDPKKTIQTIPQTTLKVLHTNTQKF
jgi:hypothetical protein